ncbi:MAG: NADPH-dependent F420 reductase [Promethearchaeota archaeon]
MKIGNVGLGVIGRTLGKKWINAGHSVKFGVRNTDKKDYISFVNSLGSNATLSNIKETINFGELIFIAIPGNAIQEFFNLYAKELSEKIIVDPTNNMGAGERNGLKYFNEYVKNAEYYRAFNNMGWENFENPKFGSNTADLFYCGTNKEGQKKVEELIMNVGLNPICIGGLERISIVDSIGGLWFALAISQKYGRHFAFKVLRD